MGIISDFISTAKEVGEGVGSGVMQELYRGALVDSNNKNDLFKQFGTSVNNRVIEQTNLLNQKKSNFNSLKADFVNNPEAWGYKGLNSEELSAIYAPLAKYLEGDTFVGEMKEVKVKIAQALKAEEIKTGDPYVPAANFFETRMSDINNQLKAVSNMGWNTWDSQIDLATYKPTELKATATAETGFKLTALNYPMLFGEPLKPGYEGLVDTTRLTLMSYNAMVESGGDELKRQKLFKEKYDAVQDSKNPINIGYLTNVLGLSGEAELEKFIMASSPYLPMISNLAAQNANLDPASEDFRVNAAKISNLATQHMEFMKNKIEEARVDTVAPASTDEAEKLRAAAFNSLDNFVNSGEVKYQLNKELKEMLSSKSSLNYSGIYMKENAGGQIDGRREEAFRFVTIPDPDEGKNARWVAVSDTGVMFYIPALEAVPVISAAADELSVGETELHYQNYARKGDFTNIAELKKHFISAIGAAVNGEVKIEFLNENVVKALENKHVFGTDKNTNKGIKYFGQSKE